ncbi:MAG: hypothetical protein KQ78_01991 [Candidatus Izimaplasma bacterium HR2]|nr:MAG: hypothetical protein KQ78_01991 [Candidatus Izimaplasma bacterium HR2]
MARTKPNLTREKTYETILKALKEAYPQDEFGDVCLGKSDEGLIFEVINEEGEIKQLAIKVTVKKDTPYDSEDLNSFVTYEEQLKEFESTGKSKKLVGKVIKK